jgi:hypothetical protein
LIEVRKIYAAISGIIWRVNVITGSLALHNFAELLKLEIFITSSVIPSGAANF